MTSLAFTIMRHLLLHLTNLLPVVPARKRQAGWLRCADLDIASALALGDKLQSILLYHMVKGALLPAALAQAQKMDTLLGMDLGTPYPLTFSTLPSGKVSPPPLVRLQYPKAFWASTPQTAPRTALLLRCGGDSRESLRPRGVNTLPL